MRKGIQASNMPLYEAVNVFASVFPSTHGQTDTFVAIVRGVTLHGGGDSRILDSINHRTVDFVTDLFKKMHQSISDELDVLVNGPSLVGDLALDVDITFGGKRVGVLVLDGNAYFVVKSVGGVGVWMMRVALGVTDGSIIVGNIIHAEDGVLHLLGKEVQLTRYESYTIRIPKFFPLE